MRPAEARRIDVVCETDDRHIREGVGNILWINSSDISNHEVGWFDSFRRLKPMLRQETLELRAEEEINPNKQDRCHA